MRFEHLSDHAGDQLRQSQARHDEALQLIQRSEQGAAEASARLRAAKRARPWWKRLFAVPTPETRSAAADVVDASERIGRARAHASGWKETIGQQGAGVQGEQALSSWLERVLPDEWSGFGGYRNKRGESDVVLVGPSGVWVVEVKNRNAELFADGDRWRFEKFDNYGNLVDSGPATDNRGRTWGQQASQVAGSLRWWLVEKNDVVAPVRSALVLVHPKAVVRSSSDPGVDLVTADARQLVERVMSDPAVVTAEAQADIEQLVRRDHRFHNKPR